MKRKTKIRPMGVSVNRPLWREVFTWAAEALVTVLIAVALGVLLIEWMAGCGQSYTDYQGTVHVGQCVFINLNRGESK